MRECDSIEQFLELVDQALFEVAELIESIEYEEVEEFAPYLPTYEQLRAQLQALAAEVKAGRHRFGGGDLPFMALLGPGRAVLPFRDLLEDINRAHRRGF